MELQKQHYKKLNNIKIYTTDKYIKIDRDSHVQAYVKILCIPGSYIICEIFFLRNGIQWTRCLSDKV